VQQLQSDGRGERGCGRVVFKAEHCFFLLYLALASRHFLNCLL